MNIKNLIIYGNQYLKQQNDIDDIPIKVQLLLCYVLGISKVELIINSNLEVDNNKFKLFKKGLDQLKNHIPLQYITHCQEFMKLKFYVDENVLIPQPDTEILVEEVIRYCNSIPHIEDKNIHILDLCTGSGAIAISLAKYIENCRITATDISPEAICIANKNAVSNAVENKINFIISDMFTSIPNNKYDIIVSNPPYIREEVIGTLSKEVQKEPKIALSGGKDGLYFYREIIKKSSSFLNNSGKLFLEIGYDQREELFELIQNSNKFNHISCIKDLSGNDRVIVCVKLNSIIN